jgi:hypothetical protein
MMLCMLPLFSVGHVPFAVGSIVGTAPLPTGFEPPEEPLEEPLEDPLDDPLDVPFPELPLEPLDPPDAPELEPPPELPLVLPERPPEEPLPLPASVLSEESSPLLKPVPDEALPQAVAMPTARGRSKASGRSEANGRRCPSWKLMALPFLPSSHFGVCRCG